MGRRKDKRPTQCFNAMSRASVNQVRDERVECNKTTHREKVRDSVIFTGSNGVRPHLAEDLRQSQHLAGEDSQADEDGVELADGAADLARGDLTQVHGERTQGNPWVKMEKTYRSASTLCRPF